MGLGDGGDAARARPVVSARKDPAPDAGGRDTARQSRRVSELLDRPSRAARAYVASGLNGFWEIERWGAHDVLAGTDYAWLFPDVTLLGGGPSSSTADQIAPCRTVISSSPLRAQDLFRVRFADGRPASHGERLLHGRFGRIGAVARLLTRRFTSTTANQEL